MGMCATPHEGDNYPKAQRNLRTITASNTEEGGFTKNRRVGEVHVGEHAAISVIHGHYSQHDGDTLVCLATESGLCFCEELRDYALEPKQTLQAYETKELRVKKGCPYARLVLCVLPDYTFKEQDDNDIHEYNTQVRVLARHILQSYADLTLSVTPSTGQGMIIPNQTIMSLVFKQMCTCLFQRANISLITPDLKMTQMIRYELLKTEACQRSLGFWAATPSV